MGENCEGLSGKIACKSPSEGIFKRTPELVKAEAIKNITKLHKDVVSGDVDRLASRIKDGRIDFEDDELKQVILNNLTQTVDAWAAIVPSDAEDADRKASLSKFFKTLPTCFYYRAVAEGLSENQLYELCQKTLEDMDDEDFEAEDFEPNPKLTPAPVPIEHDEKLDIGNRISRAELIELKDTTLHDIGAALVATFENKATAGTFNPDRFYMLKHVKLNYHAEYLADEAYVNKSGTVNDVINGYTDHVIDKLVGCVTKGKKRMRQILEDKAEEIIK